MSFVFPGVALEYSCSAIHLTASCSVMKPLTTSVSPSGHKISTPQPDPGFFRATKVGRCSDIPRICACGGPVQASYPATIKLTDYRAACRPFASSEVGHSEPSRPYRCCSGWSSAFWAFARSIRTLIPRIIASSVILNACRGNVRSCRRVRRTSHTFHGPASTGRPAAGRLRPRYQMITRYRGFRAPTVPMCGFALPVVL